MMVTVLKRGQRLRILAGEARVNVVEVFERGVYIGDFADVSQDINNPRELAGHEARKYNLTPVQSPVAPNEFYLT